MPIFVGILIYAMLLGMLGVIVLWERRRCRTQTRAKWMVTGIEIGGRDAREHW